MNNENFGIENIFLARDMQKCNTGESGIRLRRKNDYCSVAQPLTDDMRKEDEGK